MRLDVVEYLRIEILTQVVSNLTCDKIAQFRRHDEVMYHRDSYCHFNLQLFKSNQNLISSKFSFVQVNIASLFPTQNAMITISIDLHHPERHLITIKIIPR